MTAPGPGPAQFRITLLGPFEVWRDGVPLGAASWQRSVGTILKLLAMSQEHRRLRDEVIEILWPDATPESGASNLRYVLRLLRRNLGDDPPAISTDRSWIALNLAHEWEIDLARFLKLSESGGNDVEVMEEMAQLYRGEPLVEDRYEDWATPLRTHIERTWRDACRRCAECLLSNGELDAALPWLERALTVDPLDEAAVQQVMTLLVRLGRRAEAMKRFRQFEERLQSDLDLDPSPETRSIVSSAREPGSAEIVSPISTAAPHARASGAATMPQELPTGAYLGALPQGLLIARKREMAHVLATVEAAAAGNGKLLLLAGEPGVGKTRLAQEATRSLHGAGFVVAAGRCYQPEQLVPYSPFLDALSTISKVCPPHLRNELPRRWPYLLRLLPELQEHTMAAAGPSPENGEQDAPLLIRAVTGFVTAVTQDQPLALLIDDLHWADSASVNLLLHMARHAAGSRLFLLGTFREHEVTYTHPLHEAMIDLTRDGLLEKISLERLDRNATGDLIAGTLGNSALPAGLVDIVYGPSDGNPFFVQEVVRSMLEEGELFQTDGRWERKARSEIRVPDTVRAVVGQRLSRLLWETQEVLFAASVLGQTFRFLELNAVSGRSEEHVERALDEALHAGLVRETISDIYTFSHALAQQAIYAEISGRKRRRLHLAAAQTMEALPDSDRRAAEIATHFREAGETERAITYSLLAGDAAERVFAHTEAERHYGFAVEASRDISSSQEAFALEKLTETLQVQGQYGAARDCARRALSLFRALDDRDGQIRATRLLAETLQIQGHKREALALVTGFIESNPALAPSAPLALLYAELADLHGDLGEYETELDILRQTVALAQSLGDQELIDRVERNRYGPLWMLGRTGEVLDILKEHIARAEQDDDAWFLLRSLRDAGIATSYRGELRASEHYRQRQVEVARRIGDPAAISLALSGLGCTQFLLGDLHTARASMEEALNIARSTDNANVSVIPLSDLGNLSTDAGDWDDAERYLQEALQLCQQSGHLANIRIVYLYLANLDLVRGRPQAVIERLSPLLEGSRHEEMQATPLLPPLAEAYLDAGDVDRADTLASDAIRLTRKQGNQLDLYFSLVVHGRIRARQGRTKEARALLREALDLSREMSLPWGEARALWRLGRLAAKTGHAVTAGSLLSQARDLFARLGAQKELERVEADLKQMQSAQVPGR